MQTQLVVLGIVTLIAAALGVGLLAPGAGSAQSDAEYLDWDIISLDFSNAPDQLVANPGGFAEARSGDVADAGETIRLTGAGTFRVPDDGPSDVVTGGGTWETFDAEGTSTGSGTYAVTSMISWAPASGSLLGTIIVDNNGDAANSRAGLVTLAIEYSDGSRGQLTVSCELPTTSDEEKAVIQEGITATKGFVHYWNRVDPAGGIDANRTVFHVIDPLPAPTTTVTVAAGGDFLAWSYGTATASEVFGDVTVAWLWQDGAWVSYIPLLGITDYGLTSGAIVFVVAEEEATLTVPTGS